MTFIHICITDKLFSDISSFLAWNITDWDLWQEIIYSSGVKNLTLSVVLLEVVNAHTAVTLPAVGDHLGLAALHAAEPALNFTLACEGSGLLLPLPLLPVRLPPGLSRLRIVVGCRLSLRIGKLVDVQILLQGLNASISNDLSHCCLQQIQCFRQI